jgi:hypothetical protein
MFIVAHLFLVPTCVMCIVGDEKAVWRKAERAPELVVADTDNTCSSNYEPILPALWPQLHGIACTH